MHPHRLFMVVDTNPRVRLAIRGLLEAEFPDAAIVEAASAEEALGLAEAQAYSLILLDVRLAGRNGISALPRLRKCQPGAPIVMVANVPGDQYAPAAMRAGASAFVSKERVHEDLCGVVAGLLA